MASNLEISFLEPTYGVVNKET